MPSLLRRCAGLSLALLVLAPTAARAAADGPDWYKEPNVNAEWTQATIPSTDGVTLHADILRPKGLKATDRTPVILSAGPYFNHSGQEGPVGLPTVVGGDYDAANSEAGPSRRFQDFVVGAKLMRKGYTFIMVDLRGFGGSTGCLDWAGPGEQADVKSSVEWAASQPFSTGKVGMYGKSYDGVTGLMGIATQPKGLAAVITQEPVFDLYRYLYSNGVRFVNSVSTPALYDAIAATPGVAGGDGEGYLQSNAESLEPSCLAQNYLAQASDNDHASDYWKQRDLIARTKGKTTPTFLTQGFLENNTKPDGAWDFYNGLAGPKRAWFGMWDHIRGNDEAAEGANDYTPWFDESMRFFDHYVAGKDLAEAPTDKDPPVEVQTEDGKWRAEAQWPPADAVDYPVTLKTGSYDDDGQTDGSAEGAGTATDAPGAQGVWTFSKPLTSAAHFSGVPRVKLDLAPQLGVPDAGTDQTLTNVNVAVDVYDVDAAGKAILLSRTAALVPTSGKLDLGMYGNDWHIPAGHRVGVLVTDSNFEWYQPVPSGDTVTIKSASIALPFLTTTRTTTIPGKVASRLAEWLEAAPFTIPAKTITDGTAPAFEPPATKAASSSTPPPASPSGSGSGAGAGSGSSSAATPTPASTPAAPGATGTSTPSSTPATTTTPTVKPIAFTVGLSFPPGHGARKVKLSGRGTPGATVVVQLKRAGRVVLARSVKVGADGTYRALFSVRRGGSYVATAASGGRKATSRRVLVKVFGKA